MITSGLVTMYNYTAIKSSNGKYRIGCANCHPTDTGHHRDGHIDVTINKNKSGRSSLAGLNSATADFINVAGSGISGTTKVSVTCSMVYCHSSGRSTAEAQNDFKTTPNWYSAAGSTANRCGMCHENPPQYAGQSHYVSPSSMGNNGTAPYKDSGHMVGIHFKNTYKGTSRNGFLGYSLSRRHGPRQCRPSRRPSRCDICHSGIVDPTKVDTYAMYGTGKKFRLRPVPYRLNPDQTPGRAYHRHRPAHQRHQERPLHRRHLTRPRHSWPTWPMPAGSGRATATTRLPVPMTAPT